MERERVQTQPGYWELHNRLGFRMYQPGKFMKKSEYIR